VNTQGSVHRVADCQPPQLDAVGDELVVLQINPNQGDTKEGREEVLVYCLLDILPFFLELSADHYRCNIYYVPEMRAYRILGSAKLFPQCCQVSNLSNSAHLKALTGTKAARSSNYWGKQSGPS